MSNVLLGLALVLPGVWAYWTGRRFCQHRSETLGPERWLKYHVRSFGALVVSIILSVTLAADKPFAWLWGLLVPWLALAVGRYPATRFQAGGDWSFRAYLDHGVRFGFAFGFTWLFLILVPIAMGNASADMRPVVALVVTLIWFLWSTTAAKVIPRAVRARPIEDASLRELFAAIIGRAGIPTPRICRVDTPRGLWPNACALVGRRSPSVLMGSTLLDALTPEETAAIFAHEVAHIEHFRGPAGKRIALIQWFAFTVGLAAYPLLDWLDVSGVFTAPALLWLNLMFMGLAQRQSGGKQHEADSDARAVALCGDGEALIRGLTKIHVLASLPRRWDAKFDQNATHPSLARRIQAIRQAAGIATPPPAVDTVIATARPGSYLVFSPQGLTVLEDAATAHATADAAALSAAAKVRRSWSYDKLRHLAIVTAAREASTLELVETGGGTLTVPLRDDNIPTVQAALDAVDGLLSAKPAPARPASPWLLAVAVLTLTCLVGTGSVVPLALVCFVAVVVWRPTVPLLAATTAACLAAAALRALAWSREPGDAEWGALAILTFVGGLFAVLAARYHAVRGELPTRSTRTTTVLALVVLLVPLIGAPWSAEAATLHRYALEHPLAGVPLIALAAWLWMLGWQPRLGRALALLAVGAGLLPVYWSTDWYATHRIHDPFLAPAPAITWQELGGHEPWAPHPEARLAAMELAPAGDALLYRTSDTDDEDDEDEPSAEAASRATTFAWQSRHGQRLSFEAHDAAVLDGNRALVLRTEGATSVLELRALDATPVRVEWSHALPALRHATLAVEPDRGRWRVIERRASKRTVIDGRVGADEDTRATVTTQARGMFVAAGDGTGGLLIVPEMSSARPPSWAVLAGGLGGLMATLPTMRSTIWQVDDAGASTRRLAEASTWVTCADATLGSRRFLCATRSARHGTLGWVEERQGTLAVTPLPCGRDGVLGRHRAGPDETAAWDDLEHVYWVDSRRSVGARLSLAAPAAQVASGPGAGKDEARRDRRSYMPVHVALGRGRMAVAKREQSGWRIVLYRTP